MRTLLVSSIAILAACGPGEPQLPPIPERCVDLPLGVSLPDIEGPTLHFGSQGGNHIFAAARVTGLDEGGRLALVMADPDTSEVLGTVNLDVERLLPVDDDPCVRDVPRIELRFDTNIEPFRVVTLRAVATRTSGEATSSETTACLVPPGGDPSDCGMTLTLMRLAQDGRPLLRDGVLYLDGLDLETRTWMAQLDVQVDPSADGRVEVRVGGEPFEAALAAGDAEVPIEVRSGRYPETLVVTSFDELELELAREEFRVLPVPRCPLAAEDAPCLTYWDTILVDGAGLPIVESNPVAPESLDGAALWIESGAFIVGEVRLQLTCDDVDFPTAPALPSETMLDYLAVALDLPGEAGSHACLVTVFQDDPAGLRILTETAATYTVE